MHDPLMLVITAEMTALWWCSLFHRKHHEWTSCRRDCLKCGSWKIDRKKWEVEWRRQLAEVKQKFNLTVGFWDNGKMLQSNDDCERPWEATGWIHGKAALTTSDPEWPDIIEYGE